MGRISAICWCSQQGRRDFCYGCASRPAPAPPSTLWRRPTTTILRPASSSPSPILPMAAPVTTSSTWTRDELSADVLRQYERYLVLSQDEGQDLAEQRPRTYPANPGRVMTRQGSSQLPARSLWPGTTGGEGCPHHLSQQRKAPGPLLVTALNLRWFQSLTGSGGFHALLDKAVLGRPGELLSAAAFCTWPPCRRLRPSSGTFARSCSWPRLASFLVGGRFRTGLPLALAEASLTHSAHKAGLDGACQLSPPLPASDSCCAPEVALCYPLFPCP